ncbi:exodeoxyribonuclease V subunit alpha [Lujinxingia vulgaris]|nr:exodeoxyribonuclease V subunit alpha [Lujinxingia vulgaris]
MTQLDLLGEGAGEQAQDGAEDRVVSGARGVFARSFRVDASLLSARDVSSLADHLNEQGISQARFNLALNLVSMQRDLSATEHRALLMVVLASMLAQSMGSTYMPIDEDGGEYLKVTLGQLLPQPVPAGWEIDGLIDAFHTLRRERRAGQILGQPGEFKPLIEEGGRLYHQRMLLHEERLAEAIERMLMRPDRDYEGARVRAEFKDVIEAHPVTYEVDGVAHPIKPGAEQQLAALTALYAPLTLITGGPGTGKTTIVVTILRLAARLGLDLADVALAAPTGKAANRMAESIRGQLEGVHEPTDLDHRLLTDLPAPATLHRLLGYSPRTGTFRHNRNHRLSAKLVVVDEASMIDLFMMEALAQALGDDAQLVLLGDREQLPSVDTGAVLRDLLPEVPATDQPWRELAIDPMAAQPGKGRTARNAVRLTKSHRMREDDPSGSAILKVAQAVGNGFKGLPADKLPSEIKRVKEDVSLASWQGVELWTPPSRGGDTDEKPTADLKAFVAAWFKTHIGSERCKKLSSRKYTRQADGTFDEASQAALKELMAHYARARVLTLTRVFATGSESLNRQFHRAFGQFRGSKKAEAKEGAGDNQTRYVHYVGEPVMMLRNDYERDLFNGDQGVVVWVKDSNENSGKKPELYAVFERGERMVAYPAGELRDDLVHAYAMTVHKSQGSEFRHIAVVLPTQDMPLLTRELLYTGITRASKGVLLVGSEELLRVGSEREARRFSGVGGRLG